jgi:hypothetical protein
MNKPLRKTIVRSVVCGLCLIAFQQCKKEEQTCVQIINQTIGIQSGHTANNCVPPLSLKFEGVQSDSRCPSGISCVTGGYAEVLLSLTFGDSTRTVLLNTNTPKYGEAFGYRIEMFSLTPDPPPNLKTDPNLYIARVKISPQ